MGSFHLIEDTLCFRLRESKFSPLTLCQGINFSESSDLRLDASIAFHKCWTKLLTRQNWPQFSKVIHAAKQSSCWMLQGTGWFLQGKGGLENGLPVGYFLIICWWSMSAVLLHIPWLHGSERYPLPMAQGTTLCLLVIDFPEIKLPWRCWVSSNTHWS